MKNCDIYCVPTSQYTCSNDGSRECLGRWTGENCDILTPCPAGKTETYACFIIQANFPAISSSGHISELRVHGFDLEERQGTFDGNQ